MTTQILNFSFNNTVVSFRADGFLNATAIAKHFGKQPRDYLKTEQTQQYIAALAEYLSSKTKVLVEENQLVVVKNGGNARGTWLHPKLAIHFARWLDPRFAVWCDEQIEHILSGSLKLETQSPTFSQSELRKLATVTYYCAWATQMLRDVAEPLHALGYEKAITMRTLASESRLFLHDTHQALTREMPKIASAFERADMQNSLTRCEFLM